MAVQKAAHADAKKSVSIRTRSAVIASSTFPSRLKLDGFNRSSLKHF